MIRVNLLAGPRARKAKGQWNVQVELAAAVGLVVLTLGACLFYAGILEDEIEVRQNAIKDKKIEIAKLQVKVKEVLEFEKKKTHLENLNRVIAQLEKNRTGPVRILDSLSRSLEPLKVWLVSVRLKGKRVELSGVAMGNDAVVEFINNLRGGGQFKNVRLVEIRAGLTAKVNVFKFKLILGVKGKAKGKKA